MIETCDIGDTDSVDPAILSDVDNTGDLNRSEEASDVSETSECEQESNKFLARGTNKDAVKLFVALYPQMDTSGEIGGIHTGKVWMNTVMDRTGSLLLKGFSSNKMFHGLSFYNPIQKQVQLADYKDRSKFNSYIPLPFLLLHIFQSDEYWREEYLEYLHNELFTKIPEIIALKEQQIQSIEHSPKNRVRFEFFCKTENLKNDILFPSIPVDKMISMMNQKKLKDTLTNQIKSVLFPLKNLVLYMANQNMNDIKIYDAFNNISSDAKTTLLYALEKVVDSLEIMKYVKRGILRYIDEQCLKKFKHHPRNFFAGLPPQFVRQISEATSSNIEMHFSLMNPNILHDTPWGWTPAPNNPTLVDSEDVEEIVDYSLPPATYHEAMVSSHNNLGDKHYQILSTVFHVKRMEDVRSRLTDQDMRKLPDNCQNLGSALSRESLLPKIEINLKMRLKQAFFDFTTNENTAEADSRCQIPIIFPEEDYRKCFIVDKTEEEINNFLDTLICLLYEAYDASFAGIFKNALAAKKRKDPAYRTNAIVTLEGIPRTKYEYDTTWGKMPDATEDVEEDADSNRDDDPTFDVKPLLSARPDQNYLNNIPSIRNPRELISNCFAKATGNKKENKIWNSLPCVRFYEEDLSPFFVSTEEFLMTQTNYDKRKIYTWRKDYFDKRLFTQMNKQRRRKSASDGSMFIVWDMRLRSKKILYNRIRPILVADPDQIMICTERNTTQFVSNNSHRNNFPNEGITNFATATSTFDSNDTADNFNNDSYSFRLGIQSTIEEEEEDSSGEQRKHHQSLLTPAMLNKNKREREENSSRHFPSQLFHITTKKTKSKNSSAEKQKKGRTSFFLELKENRELQVDDVICNILCDGFERINSSPTAKRLEKHLQLTSNYIVFGRIMGTEADFNTKIQNFNRRKRDNSNFRKKLERLRFKPNMRDRGDKLILFEFNREDDLLMLNALQKGQKKLALDLTHQGLVNEKILETLMEDRITYEKTNKSSGRNTGSGVQAIKEKHLSDSPFRPIRS